MENRVQADIEQKDVGDKLSIPPNADSVILRTEPLGRTVNSKILIQDANFEVSIGQVLAIVGPRGSGKSSLLRLLNRLNEPPFGTALSKAPIVAISSREYYVVNSAW
jgi:ABC-type multidrug transport system fused ATPase/permease subunit